MPVAPGEALPYMQPAQASEQPIATDPDLIEAGSIPDNAEAEETGLTLHTEDEDDGTVPLAGPNPVPAVSFQSYGGYSRQRDRANVGLRHDQYAHRVLPRLAVQAAGRQPDAACPACPAV